jgi:4-aminobutyrate aminotransferase/(S)-3-amino-2-methylpropionate transaminase
VDEVQTGFGRTGRLFAIEHSQVEPDLIVLAKTLGGGMPLAAVVGRAELMDATAPGGLGGTFGGNPVACAGALAIIDVLLQERLPARAEQIGRTAMERMRSWAERVPAIGEVRGMGAMVAMELVKDRISREPDPQLTTAILHRCHDRGLAILKAGLYDNVIRLLPPLTISDDELRRGLDILEESVSASE